MIIHFLLLFCTAYNILSSKGKYKIMAELNIVLVEPEIPQNTGNIARTCAATGAKLHLVRPLGFSISEKAVKRAGLDYWDLVDISVYDNIQDFFEKTDGIRLGADAACQRSVFLYQLGTGSGILHRP